VTEHTPRPWYAQRDRECVIAAAPDMYDWINWILHLHHDVGKSGEPPTDDEWKACLAEGMKVRAKARGEQP
jgi:hypothetical protein